MATPTSNSPSGKDQSWRTLIATAREAQPPETIDVRAAVRQAILAERPVPTLAPGLFDDLLFLFRHPWMRATLAGGIAGAAALLIAGLVAAREVLIASQLAWADLPFL